MDVPIKAEVRLNQLLVPEIQQLLDEYKPLFTEPTNLPPTKGPFDHRISLITCVNSINIRPYRYPSTHKNVIERLVEELLELGIVQPISSPYASPVVLVSKKNGSWRLCVDYSSLNKITIKYKFPIPVIEELLDELGGSKIYTKLDLGAGYHQIRVDESDVVKIAFKIHSGHYEYLMMPFDLTNAPSYFQSSLNFVFKDHLRKFILVFLMTF